MADLHDSTEHYLATIFEIQEEGIEIKRARIAERLNISAPSVTEHVHRMEKLGLVKVDDSNNVSLTSEGKKKATSVVRRHRLAERLLVDVIGLDWVSAHKEADRWEHVISDEVEQKLVELLGDPQTCPHGNPIPAQDGKLPENIKEAQKKYIPLSTVESDHKVIVRRIGERIEVNQDSLEFVATHNLLPGTSISKVLNNAGTISIKRDDDKEIEIPAQISEAMYVEVV